MYYGNGWYFREIVDDEVKFIEEEEDEDDEEDFVIEEDKEV